MLLELNQDLQDISRRLNQAGFTVYLVGGSLRDYLLGREINDFDLTSSARPEEIMQLFPKVIPTGIKHGTVTVMYGGSGYEITTMRCDGQYKDGRHPESVDFTTDINEDLARRDFTINALAYRLPDGPLVDLFGGQNDLKAQLIRAVGQPERRFREDGLRLLRAARFAGQLGFKLEPETRAALSTCREMADHVSRERTSHELCRLLTSPKPEYGLELLAASGLLGRLWPELAPLPAAHFATIKNYPERLACRLTQLLRPLTTAPRKTLAQLKLPTALTNQVLRLWTFLQQEPPTSAPAIRAWLAGNADLLEDYLALLAPGGRHIAALAQNEPLYTDHTLAISSKTLLTTLGLTPGPLLGQLRRHLLEQVWADPGCNREDLLLQAAQTYLEKK